MSDRATKTTKRGPIGEGSSDFYSFKKCASWLDSSSRESSKKTFLKSRHSCASSKK
jgi:hypothetical protein